MELIVFFELALPLPEPLGFTPPCRLKTLGAYINEGSPAERPGGVVLLSGKYLHHPQESCRVTVSMLKDPGMPCQPAQNFSEMSRSNQGQNKLLKSPDSISSL